MYIGALIFQRFKDQPFIIYVRIQNERFHPSWQVNYMILTMERKRNTHVLNSVSKSLSVSHCLQLCGGICQMHVVMLTQLFLLLLNLMPLYRRIILMYIVVKDIFTGLLSTMKTCELFHNFQEYYSHILCKQRRLSKIYQFNKSSWWIPFSPAFPALCNLLLTLVLYYPISFCERLHVYLISQQ